MLNKIFSILFAVFIIAWISKLIFFFPSDYDLRHGKNVAISYMFILICLGFSFVSILYVFFKKKNTQFIFLGISLILFIKECFDLIGIGQE